MFPISSHICGSFPISVYPAFDTGCAIHLDRCPAMLKIVLCEAGEYAVSDCVSLLVIQSCF